MNAVSARGSRATASDIGLRDEDAMQQRVHVIFSNVFVSSRRSTGAFSAMASSSFSVSAKLLSLLSRMYGLFSRELRAGSW